MPNLKATFETLVDTFVFLDKNKDGYVSKSEMVDAINETSSGERSSGRIAMKRFGQYSLSLSLSTDARTHTLTWTAKLTCFIVCNLNKEASNVQKYRQHQTLF